MSELTIKSVVEVELTPTFYSLLIASIALTVAAVSIPQLRSELTVAAAALSVISLASAGLAAGVSGERMFNASVEPEDSIVGEGEEAVIKYRIKSSILEVASPVNAWLDTDEGVDVLGVEAILESPGNALIKVKVKGRLGRHSLGPLGIKYAVMGGVIKASSIINVLSQLRVAPTVVARAAVTAPPGAHVVGTSPSGRAGRGTQFYCVREYVPGDDFRSIEWKAYARTGRLAVKVFEHESFQGVLLGLAIHDGFFIGRPSAFEAIAREVSRLLASLIKAGLWVRLAVSTEYRVMLSSKVSSMSGFSDLLELLASIEWPKTPLPTASANRVIAWLVKEALKQVSPGPTLVVIIMEVMNESDMIMLKSLQRELAVRGHKLLVINASPPLLAISQGRLNLGTIGWARRSVERVKSLSTAYGVRVVTPPSITSEVLRLALRLSVTP